MALPYLLSSSLGCDPFVSVHLSMSSESSIFRMSVQNSILDCSVTMIRDATFTLGGGGGGGHGVRGTKMTPDIGCEPIKSGRVV